MEETESARLLDDFRAMTNLCLRVIRKNQIRTLKQAHRALYARLKARYPNRHTATIGSAYRVALRRASPVRDAVAFDVIETNLTGAPPPARRCRSTRAS
jgi:hypothetical protein